MRNWFLGMAAAGTLFLSSCFFEEPLAPTMNFPPTAELTVNPTQGKTPLETRIILDGEPEEGASITAYILEVQDKRIIKSSPIDTLMTFKTPGTFNVYGIVKDSRNLNDTAKALLNVFPLNPSLSQNLKLVNYVEIEYTAALSDIDSAALKIFKGEDSKAFFTENIHNGFKKTFNYSEDKITKGNYKFVLESPKANSQNTISVPEYAPEAELSSIDSLKFNEGDSIIITLPTPTDKNPEDNPKYEINNSLDGKVTASLNGNKLKIKAVPEKVGDYSLQLILTDSVIVKIKNLEGKLYDLLDVSGILKDNEEHVPHPGIVKVYNYEQDNLGHILDTSKIGEIEVNNFGSFSKKFDKRISELTGDILVQARWNDLGEESSYVRTMKLKPEDHRNLNMVIVPYTDLTENEITPEDFQKHMQEVLSPWHDVHSNPIISKWAFGNSNVDYNLEEIIISKYNPDTTKTGYFSDATAEQIRDRILNSDDIGAFFNGKIEKYNITITITDTAHNYSLPKDYGKIVLYPDEQPTDPVLGGNLAGYTSMGDPTRDGYLDYAKSVVQVFDGNTRKELVAHELGRASDGLIGCDETLPGKLTIMHAWGGDGDGPLFADRKTAKAIYEDSYVPGTGSKVWFTNYDLGLKDILGLNFLDGSKK